MNTVNFLLIALCGAVYFSLVYEDQCRMGQCPWSKEPAPKSLPVHPEQEHSGPVDLVLRLSDDQQGVTL